MGKLEFPLPQAQSVGETAQPRPVTLIRKLASTSLLRTVKFEMQDQERFDASNVLCALTHHQQQVLLEPAFSSNDTNGGLHGLQTLSSVESSQNTTWSGRQPSIEPNFTPAVEKSRRPVSDEESDPEGSSWEPRRRLLPDLPLEPPQEDPIQDLYDRVHCRLGHHPRRQ